MSPRLSATIKPAAADNFVEVGTVTCHGEHKRKKVGFRKIAPLNLTEMITQTTFVAHSFKEKIMGMPVRIDTDLYDQAKLHANAERRTIAGQIEFWALIGKAALDNPDLPIDFVRDLLVAKAEGNSLATPFVPQD